MTRRNKYTVILRDRKTLRQIGNADVRTLTEARDRVRNVLPVCGPDDEVIIRNIGGSLFTETYVPGDKV